MTKKEALKLARDLKSQGKQVKVYKRVGCATVPGRGVTAFVNYEVVEVK